MIKISPKFCESPLFACWVDRLSFKLWCTGDQVKPIQILWKVHFCLERIAYESDCPQITNLLSNLEYRIYSIVSRPWL